MKELKFEELIENFLYPYVELTMEELEKYSGYVSWIDVCKESDKK